VLPANGAQGVPTNARMIVSEMRLIELFRRDPGAQPELRLLVVSRRGSLVPVSAALERLSNDPWSALFLLTPAAPLAPETEHVLVVVDPDQRVTHDLTRFRTGAGPDAVAPRFRGVRRARVRVGPTRDVGTCAVREEGHSSASWSFAPASDDTTAVADLLFVLSVRRGEGSRQPVLVGPWGADGPPPGGEDVLCSLFRPGLTRGATLCVSIEVVDLAGNRAGGDVERCTRAPGRRPRAP
jgi:hypothetical protein